MAAQLEQIISQLLVSDSEAINAATQQLKVACKEPAFVPTLCHLVGTSANATIRQYAAVIMRQKIERSWSKLSKEEQLIVQNTVLQVLETAGLPTPLRNAVTGVACVIAKHQFQSWPELLNFITRACCSEVVQAKELGLYVLGVICDAVGMEMEPHYTSLFQLFATCLTNHACHEVLHFTCVAMSKLVPYLGPEHMPGFGALLPSAINAVQVLLTVDEEKACTAFELFDDLLECEIGIIVPHLQALLTLCLEVAKTLSFSDSTRIKFMTFISWLVSAKKKALQKLGLVSPILDVLLPLLACTEQDQEDEAESQQPGDYAGNVLDTMALHLPAEKFMPMLFQSYISPCIISAEPLQRKAGLTALAIVAEGCCEYMLDNMLAECLQIAGNGLQDTEPIVRNAALYALGQFAEHFQPGISDYSNEILPVLCQKISEEMGSESSSLTRTYYALESFCENMGDKIVPYLPDLVEKLVVTMATSPSIHGRELAISALGAVANAAEDAIVPFLAQIMAHLKVFLTSGETEDELRLKTQAIDTLSVFARKIGKETFGPMAAECVALGMTSLTIDDPDMRRCVYGLLASVSTSNPASLTPHMEAIAKRMFESLDCTDGMTTEYKNSGVPKFDLDDSVEEGQGEESDDEDEVLGDYENIEGIVVENSYLEEKGDTLNSLAELCSNMSVAFAPFYEECFSQSLKFVDYNAPIVRRGAIMAMSHVCCALHKSIKAGYQDENAFLQKFLSVSLPLIYDIIKGDKEREIVCCALECLNEILKEMGSGLTDDSDCLESLVDVTRSVLQHQTACQKDEEDDSFCEDVDDDSELTTVLMDFAGSLLPSLAKALGGQKFTPYFKIFLPLVVPKEGKNRSERSLAAGTLAELCQAMKESIIPFTDKMYNIFMKGVKDQSDDVVSNSVFGVGVLVEASGNTLVDRYPVILETLSQFLKEGGDRRTIDNVLGAVARMIITNPTALPLDMLFPTFVKWLPLQEDMEENEMVYQCIYTLLSNNAQCAVQQIPTLLPMMAGQLPSKKLDDSTKAQLVQIIKGVASQYQEETMLTMQSVNPEHAELLKQAIGS